MKEPADEISLRRILVALDASPPSLAALDVAAELAKRLGAELLGLFVEDVEFLRLAELPHVHLSLPSGADDALDPARARAHLRALADEARAALTAAADRCRVPGSFRVVRGVVAAEVLAAARGADIVILGRVSRALVPRGRVGGTARAAVEAAAGSVLLSSLPSRLDRGLLAVADSSPGSRKALALAARLRREGTPFTVIALGETEGEAEARVEEARRLLGESGAGCRFQLARGRQAARHALAASGHGLVVVSAESPLLKGGEQESLLERLVDAVLLVR